jgi:hypothetical protein
MPNNTSTSRKIGTVLFWIGALYLLGGFATSWWIVPAARGGDADFFSSFLGFIWSMSFPLGSLLVMIGGGLMGGVKRGRLAYLIGGWLVFAAWLIISPPQFTPVFFGIGGGLIMLSFLVVLWSWARGREALSGSERLGADLQMFAHVFWVIAAWHICGLMGPPFFALRPELMEQDATKSGILTLGSTIMAELVIGWVLSALGQRLALRAKTMES